MLIMVRIVLVCMPGILFVNIKGNIYIYCLAKYFGAIFVVQAEQKAHVGE